jgi:hypothetical protein
VFLPVSIRIEKRAVIHANVLVDKDIALTIKMRPEIRYAGIQTGFEVHVKESQDDLPVEIRKGVPEPALNKLTAADIAVFGDVGTDLIEGSTIISRLISPRFTVKRISSGQALERIADRQFSAYNPAC